MTTAPPDATTAGLRTALRRYQLMSYVVGAMLLLMVCGGLPLQYLAHKPALPQVGWTIHGGLYVVYLVSAGDLARRARFSVLQLLGVICAGFLPGLAFAVERRTTRRIAATLEAPPA